MTPDELQAEREAVRAASAPGELKSKQPEPSLGRHVRQHLRDGLLFSLVVTLLTVALVYFLSPGN